MVAASDAGCGIEWRVVLVSVAPYPNDENEEFDRIRCTTYCFPVRADGKHNYGWKIEDEYEGENECRREERLG